MGEGIFGHTSMPGRQMVARYYLASLPCSHDCVCLVARLVCLTWPRGETAGWLTYFSEILGARKIPLLTEAGTAQMLALSLPRIGYRNLLFLSPIL